MSFVFEVKEVGKRNVGKDKRACGLSIEIIMSRRFKKSAAVVVVVMVRQHRGMQFKKVCALVFLVCAKTYHERVKLC